MKSAASLSLIKSPFSFLTSFISVAVLSFPRPERAYTFLHNFRESFRFTSSFQPWIPAAIGLNIS